MRLIVNLSMWLFASDMAFDILIGFSVGYQRGQACASRAADLVDSSQQVREDTARDFAKCSLGETFSISVTSFDTAEYLRRSIVLGNSTPQALLLLGRSMDNESRAFLEQRRLHPQQTVRWARDSQPVSESLAASVARMRQAAKIVKPDLLKAAANAGTAEAEFLLDVLPYLDDRELIAQLAKFLGDTRPLPNRAMRVCDYALSRVATKLKLKLSFSPTLSIFDGQQLDEVRLLAARALR